MWAFILSSAFPQQSEECLHTHTHTPRFIWNLKDSNEETSNRNELTHISIPSENPFEPLSLKLPDPKGLPPASHARWSLCNWRLMVIDDDLPERFSPHPSLQLIRPPSSLCNYFSKGSN